MVVFWKLFLLRLFRRWPCARRGYPLHPVVKRAESFLVHSVREDGSSPIDTNLSLWLTSLSLQVLSDGVKHDLVESISNWVAVQQREKQDAYSGAEPGGWAWTPLPGGVPDADDTSAALCALAMSGYQDRTVLQRGLNWLVNLQNSDGGIPTFCKGWGQLPFDQSCSDITAHAIRAFQLYENSSDGPLPDSYVNCKTRAMRYLAQQREDGSWLPCGLVRNMVKIKRTLFMGHQKFYWPCSAQVMMQKNEQKRKLLII